MTPEPSAASAHQYVLVYCHGRKRLARIIQRGQVLCPCGATHRAVTDWPATIRSAA